ncbi:MAG: hypothetical protein IPK26_10545 [Planctomycetes bacterium]|nr:hypothetical protein [Planctomycetota bacterium]
MPRLVGWMMLWIAATVVAQAPPLADRVATALTNARPALLGHLAKVDGGMLALSCLAALHDGVPTDDPVFAKALQRLAKHELEDTYDLALRLMVLAEASDLPDRERLAERDTQLLLRKQTTGGFSYGGADGWWDLSNTQYAALGLRAAVALGQQVPIQRWRVLYQALERMQHEDGAFTYRIGQGRPSAYASMTVAGIAVLEICAQQMDLDEPSLRQHRRTVERSWRWLAERGKEIGDRRTRFSYYFHYGLERAAILSEVDRVGEVDWYAAGATMLCNEQLARGGWYGSEEHHPDWPRGASGHPVDTAFAILFLRRKFQKVLAPVTGPRACRTASLPADATDEAVKLAAQADAAGGDLHVPALLACLRSDLLPRRKAAVLALFRLAGADFGFTPYRDPRVQAAALRDAELWWLKRRAGR